MNARFLKGRSAAFSDVPWSFYVQTRQAIDSHTQVTFDRGRMEIISTTTLGHESAKKLLAMLFETYCFARDVPLNSTGGLTLARASRAVACEPDESYYVLADPPPRGTREIDLEIHDPPDLVLEVDPSEHAVDKEPVLAALGVAEVWRWEADALAVRRLRPDRSGYESFDGSGLIPTLPMAAIEAHVRLGQSSRQHDVLRQWRGIVGNA